MIYQLSVYLHLLSAIVWVGGMLFLALVVVPATRGLAPPERGALFAALGQRFRTIGWVAIAVLLVTGVINTASHGVTWESVVTGQLLRTPFGHVLVTKLALVAAMLALSVVHDFVLGPASTRLARDPQRARSPEAEALRRRAAGIARVNALLALAVIALAIVLVRGLPA